MQKIVFFKNSIIFVQNKFRIEFCWLNSRKNIFRLIVHSLADDRVREFRVAVERELGAGRHESVEHVLEGRLVHSHLAAVRLHSRAHRFLLLLDGDHLRRHAFRRDRIEAGHFGQHPRVANRHQQLRNQQVVHRRQRNRLRLSTPHFAS